MAWKRRPRRRRGTEWRPSPLTLSHHSGETPVQAVSLQNLAINGTATGTLAAKPQPLDIFFDDLAAASADSLTEGNVEKRTFLRLVGMLRPVVAGGVLANNALVYGAPAEVRYAIYRGNSDQDEADWESTPGTFEVPETSQPDLWLSTHLGSERIAYLRSFIMPDQRTSYGVDVDNVLAMKGVPLLQWFLSPELSVIDLRSKRAVSTSSKMYLLRQVRWYDASTIGDQQELQSAQLYYADFARLLASRRIG